MPIYYQKVPTQIEDENRNCFGNQEGQNSKTNSIKQSKASSYYELSEYDSSIPNTILSIDKIYLEENVELERIETRYGSVIVGKQTYGQQMANKKSTDDPVTAKKQEPKQMKLNSIILTVHDVGLNHESNYLQFFNNLDTKILLKNFTVYHINLPGQHTSSEKFDSIYSYPTMDRLSEIIDFVVSYYDIENFIGFGQGAGANLLIRFAIKKPNKVNGLFFINPTYSQASWVEWIYQKRNIKHLQADKNSDKNETLLLSPIVQDYLIYLQFGKASPERDLDSLRTIEEYRNYFKSRFIDSINLSLFIDSYVKRKFINLSKDGSKGTNKLQCECTILAGSLSSMRNESNQLYFRLSPDKANWIKFDNCGNPLLEKPIKVLEIFKLFLLGLGYTIKHSVKRPSQISIKKSASAAVMLNEAKSSLIDFFTPN